MACAVMPVTVLDADGLGQDSDIIEGIVWAVDHGADVINLSFSQPRLQRRPAGRRRLRVGARRRRRRRYRQRRLRARRPTRRAIAAVIGVSNTDRSDSLHPTSNHGAATFLGAPGTSITTLRAGGGTTSVTGTSASAAEVAAAAALLRAIDPDASNGTIVGRLARSAAPAGTRAETGNGRLDLARAVRDRGTNAVQPEGVPGAGGPFVGPYVAAAATVQATTTLDGSTGTINVAPGASITLAMRVTTNGSGTADDWNSSRWAFGTTAPVPGSMTCVDHGNHSVAGPYTETFSITAPATAGNYNLYLYRLQRRCLRLGPGCVVHPDARARQPRAGRDAGPAGRVGQRQLEHRQHHERRQPDLRRGVRRDGHRA